MAKFKGFWNVLHKSSLGIFVHQGHIVEAFGAAKFCCSFKDFQSLLLFLNFASFMMHNFVGLGNLKAGHHLRGVN